jgi:hypothetical protein
MDTPDYRRRGWLRQQSSGRVRNDWRDAAGKHQAQGCSPGRNSVRFLLPVADDEVARLATKDDDPTTNLVQPVATA